MKHAALKLQIASLNQVASAYKSIQDDISALEEELATHRSILEEAALATPHLMLDLQDFRVNVSPSERDVFSLKEAREQLGDKTLRPYLRLSKYNRLKVSAKAA